MKFPEERGDPDEFRGRIGNSFILSFGTGSGHGWLFLGAPGTRLCPRYIKKPLVERRSEESPAQSASLNDVRMTGMCWYSVSRE